MIGFVHGIVEYVSEELAILDVGGVGYNIHVSADTASKMPGLGEEAKLYTYTSVREDAIWLYGFLTRQDLEIFKKCITVSGIGPKGALSILSVMDADTLRYAIMAGDKKAISKAPGVGPKMAERLILELKDKVSIDDEMIGREIAQAATGNPLMAADTPEKKEAVEALVALGYGQTESVRAVNAVPGVESMDSGSILKAALKKMF
ncbi:MAG: Holliday junction branch migration protein RuvA [Lachnospiraceae bacterium]|nr:Holliday junction branch migration protein RuvA [Lachnospiraceae bacterium]MBP5264236.1 Holliday junction branch migration protein RuvA [Lachnospiraceae bacterium]